MNYILALLWLTSLNLVLLGFVVYRQLKQKETSYHFDASFQNLKLSAEQLKENLFPNAANLQQAFADRLNQFRLQHSEALSHFKEQLQQAFSEQRSGFDKHQLESLKI